MKKWLPIGSVMIAAMFLLSACGGGDSMTIGAQTYTETKIVAYMYKDLIEDQTDISAKVKPDLNTSQVLVDGMKKDDFQLGTQYTGTALEAYFSIDHPDDRDAVFQEAKEKFADKPYNFKWLKPLGWENSYGFAVRQDYADKHDIDSYSDLKKVASDATLGVDTSWMERKNDGYKAFTKKYGFEFNKTKPMEIGLVYDAVKSKDVDVVLAYTSDPRINSFDLKILDDDKNFFPPYDAAPVFTKDFLDDHPDAGDAIKPLVGKLDVDTIRDLSGKVDNDKKDPKDVAKNYLKDQGLLK